MAKCTQFDLREECSPGVLETDTSEPSSWTVLPRVIEKNDRTIIGHGMADYILLVNGTIMAVQNMVRLCPRSRLVEPLVLTLL